jgi:predicted DNA-binding antitoxin AbrB/MazE fold protein
LQITLHPVNAALVTADRHDTPYDSSGLDFQSVGDRLDDMNPQFDAIYDNGVFKPLTPLSLPDKAHVRLIIGEQQVTGEQQGPRPAVEPNDEWERQLLSTAKNCGVSLPDSAFSSDALYE